MWLRAAAACYVCTCACSLYGAGTGCTVLQGNLARGALVNCGCLSLCLCKPVHVQMDSHVLLLWVVGMAGLGDPGRESCMCCRAWGYGASLCIERWRMILFHHCALVVLACCQVCRGSWCSACALFNSWQTLIPCGGVGMACAFGRALLHCCMWC